MSRSDSHAITYVPVRRGGRPRIEAHLRRILKTYAAYYNEVRTRLSLGKNAPNFRPSKTVGNIVAMPILGGLLHQRSALSFDEAQRGNRQLIYLGVCPSFLRRLQDLVNFV
jgi:hypothetical protein